MVSGEGWSRDAPEAEGLGLRRRLFVVGSVLSTLSFLAFCFKQLSDGVALLGWLDLAAALGSGVNLAAYALHRRLSFAIHVLLLCVFASLSGLVLASGGIGMPAPFLLSVVPLGATALTGSRRSGALFAVACLGLIAVLAALHASDFAFPAAVREADTAVRLMLSGAAASVLITTLFAVSGAWLQQSSLDRLQVANADLARAEDAARVASDSKTQFLANMSHEIRTPMNGILGSLQLLRDLPEPREEARELTSTALSSAQALLTLLDDIIDLAKAESGKLTFERIPMDLSRTVREVAQLFSTGAIAKGVEVRANYAAGCPSQVAGDPVRIRQVLSNLVGNAVKFTARGRVDLRVRREGDWLRLEVEDTGIGLTPEQLGRVFDAFEQADASTTRRFGGTGLGLAVSRRLAEGMGGRLSAKSALGEGSTFTLELPLEVAEGPVPKTPLFGAAPLAVGARVLLVEDNRTNQLVAGRMLERLGYQVDVCADGQAAVDRADADRFDAVLMDCHMPNLDGYAATRALRARGVQTPIIALTASVTAADRARCADAGMDDFLSKPIERRALAEALERWTTDRRSANVGPSSDRG